MRKILPVVMSLCFGFAATAKSQETQSAEPDPASNTETSSRVDYRDWVNPSAGFRNNYRPQAIPDPRLENSPRITNLIADDRLELSLAEAQALALENNLDIKVQRYILPIAQTDVLRALSGQAVRGFAGVRVPGGLNSGVLGAGVNESGGGSGVGSAGGITGGGGAVQIGPTGTFDPTVSFNFSWDETNSPLNTQIVAGAPSVTTESLAGSGSYSQLFSTGTSFFMSLTTIGQDSTQQFLRFNPAVISRFSFGINQPLLRGFGKEPNLRFIRVARNNERVSKELFRMQVIDTIVDVTIRYRDLSTLGRSLEVAEQSLNIANELLDQNTLKVTLGTLSPIDVIAARSEVASRQRDVIIARTNLSIQERSLKALIFSQMSATLEAVSIIPIDPMPDIDQALIPDLQIALNSAYDNRPVLRQSRMAEENQELTTHFTKNGLLPNLSVFGFFANSGLDGDTLVNNGSAGDALKQVFNGDFPQRSAGASFRMPIRNRAAQADDLRARLEFNQIRINTQKTRNTIALEVHHAIIGLQQGKAQVEAAKQAVLLAKESLYSENVSLESGLSTPYQVTLRTRDFTAAKEAEILAQAGFAKALIEMQRATGTTLKSYDIELEDTIPGTVKNTPTETSNPHFDLSAN